MSKLDELKQLITEAYPDLQERKRQKSIYRSLLRDKIHKETQNIDSNVVNKNGYVFKIKPPNKIWKWRKDFYDLLEDESKLPLAVNVSKKQESRFEISPYSIPSGHFLQLYPKKPSALISEKQEACDARLLEILVNKDFDEIVNLYKINEMKLQIAEDKMTKYKSELLSVLEDTGDSTYSFDGIGTFKIRDRDPSYDIDSMFSNKIIKRLAFAYKMSSDNTATLIDLFTDDKITFNTTEPFKYESHIITVYKNNLYFDGVHMDSNLNSFELKKGQKKQVETLSNDGYSFLSGTVSVSGMEFFRCCPISAQNVNELIDLGLLHPKVMEIYRVIDEEREKIAKEKRKSQGKSEDVFEILTESAEEDRKTRLYQQMIERSETMRYREDTALRM